jgi:nucleotide-binding universal stress UspA family protein
MATSQANIAASFKTILFATDFSSSSQAALPYVVSLAHRFASKVIAAHAVALEPLAGITPAPPAPAIDLEWQDAKEGMQAFQDTQVFTGLRHEFILERGDPMGVISDLIKNEAVDLVVLGTHGRKGLRKLFAGSVAEEIFRTATCPILTVGPGAESGPPQDWKPSLVLFATDFSRGSLHALPLAVSFAEENQAALLLLHVVPLVPWEQQPEMAQDYEQRLRKLIPEDAAHRGKIECAVRFNLAAPGILAVAEEKQAGLVVLGVHRAVLPRLDSHVPWSTAYEVVSNAHCPVLTVRG